MTEYTKGDAAMRRRPSKLQGKSCCSQNTPSGIKEQLYRDLVDILGAPIKGLVLSRGPVLVFERMAIRFTRPAIRNRGAVVAAVRRWGVANINFTYDRDLDRKWDHTVSRLMALLTWKWRAGR